jgi:hypothetical protein
LQKRLPSGLSTPQDAQDAFKGVLGSAAPHPAQNLLPGGFSVLQLAQELMGPPYLLHNLGRL